MNSIDLNNQAIAFLQEDRLVDAVTCFKDGLLLLKDVPRKTLTGGMKRKTMDVDPLSSFGDSTSSIPEDFSFSSISSFDSVDDSTTTDHAYAYLAEDRPKDNAQQSDETPSLLSVPVLTDLLLQGHQSTSLEDPSLMGVFDRALCVTNDDDMEHRELVTAVLMFNLGLVHHARGISRGRSKYLNKALNLYKMALRVIQNIQEQLAQDHEAHGITPECIRSVSHVSLLLLALLNNMTQIYSQFFRLEKMQHYLQHMRWLLSEDHELAAQYLLTDDDFAWFCTNVMCLDTAGIGHVVAPAA